MVMYYLGMKYLVHPIIRWQDRLDEKARAKAIRQIYSRASDFADHEGVAFSKAVKRGEAIGAARTYAKWRAWYERRLDAEEHGEPFNEPPPPPPQQER